MDKHDANAFINEHQTEEVNIFEKCSTTEKQTTVIREVGEEEKLPTQWEVKALFSSDANVPSSKHIISEQ